MRRRGGAGVPAVLFDEPSAWADTRENTPTTNYVRTSPFARVVYDTAATEITINSYNDLFSAYPQFTELGLTVNGVHQSVLPGGAGAQSNTITLPSGSKRIEIVNGTQTRPSGSILGTFLVSIEANDGLVRVPPAASNDLLFYGDSITVGANSQYPTGRGYAMLVRRQSGQNVGVEGFGFRSLWDDCKDATSRAAFVGKVVDWGPSKMWIGIGHNDYFLDRWSAADYGAAYAALLDDLNAALPGLTIYAQSPIIRNPDPINGFSETLTDYRAEVAAAASGRSWVTYVDGLDMLGFRSLDDGVHPTTDGHFGIAEYINYFLGYDTPPVSAVISDRSGTSVSGPDMFGMYRIEKISGGAGFNASADAGLTEFNGDFRLRMVVKNEPFDRVVGVRKTDPTLDSNYTGIEYAIYDRAVWEGLPPTPVGGSYEGDFRLPAWIMREGSTLTYRYGYDPDAATVMRTVSGVTDTLYFDTSLFNIGAIVDVSIYDASGG
jgi:lysophospholipase L1-like esterase